MKTLDDIISCVQSYALKQDTQAVAYKIEPPITQYQLLWLPQSFRELISIRNPHLFIFFSYQAILGRAPDQESAQGYHELIASGRLSMRKFALQMLSSTESAHAKSFIKINKIDRYLIALENKILSFWSGRRGAGVIGRLHDLLIKLGQYNSFHIQHSAILAKQSYDIDAKQEKIISNINEKQNHLSQQLAITSNDIRSHTIQVLDQHKHELNHHLNMQVTSLDKTIAKNTELLNDQLSNNILLVNSHHVKSTALIQDALNKNEEKIAIMANANSLNSQAVLYLNERILKHIENLTHIDQIESAPIGHALASDPAVDAYYLAFEEKFRGPEHEIRTKLDKYTPYVESFLESSQAPLLDIGMGRGEWLSLISNKGLKAQGVDQSEEMIHHCRKIGLSVIHADALDYLKTLADESIGAISSFHVVEHLPFDILYNMLKQAYRVLMPGGILILETPNPENILVGSHTFYHDFSHHNPVTPTSLQFLAEYHGFKDCEILRLNPYPESAKVPGNDLLTERVNGHLCGPQDYALIAKR
ncbi:MAG: class I SAM-dependent methyltransferase [Proteobacteria bacterium]|nr:class I SAM-dependent methyltransferase [Pseudomonadota bacterium]